MKEDKLKVLCSHTITRDKLSRQGLLPQKFMCTHISFFVCVYNAMYNVHILERYKADRVSVAQPS